METTCVVSHSRYQDMVESGSLAGQPEATKMTSQTYLNLDCFRIEENGIKIWHSQLNKIRIRILGRVMETIVRNI